MNKLKIRFIAFLLAMTTGFSLSGCTRNQTEVLETKYILESYSDDDLMDLAQKMSKLINPKYDITINELYQILKLNNNLIDDSIEKTIDNLEEAIQFNVEYKELSKQIEMLAEKISTHLMSHDTNIPIEMIYNYIAQNQELLNCDFEKVIIECEKEFTGDYCKEMKQAQISYNAGIFYNFFGEKYNLTKKQIELIIIFNENFQVENLDDSLLTSFETYLNNITSNKIDENDLNSMVNKVNDWLIKEHYNFSKEEIKEIIILNPKFMEYSFADIAVFIEFEILGIGEEKTKTK